MCSCGLCIVTKMDIELLIGEVFNRPALWNQKDKNHHNRFILDKLWDEVATILNTTRATARSKWKALRDKFRITMAALPKPKSGDPGSNKSSWKYFDNLLFLKDQFTPRESTGNLPVDSPDDTVQVILEEDYLEYDTTEVADSELFTETFQLHSQEDTNVSDDYATTATPTPTRSTSSRPASAATNISERKRKSKDDIGHALLALESKKLEYLEEKKKKKAEVDDDDMDFFKSLLPHIRHLKSSEKLSYRMKILEVTRSFVNTTEN